MALPWEAKLPLRDQSANDTGMIMDNIGERLRFAKKLRDIVRRDKQHVILDILAKYKVNQDLGDFDLDLMQLSACMFTDIAWIRSRTWDYENPIQ